MNQQVNTRERVFDLYIRSFEQLDISGKPVEITSQFSDPLVDEIHLIFRKDCYITKAGDSSEATSKLNDSAKRRKVQAGESQSYFNSNSKSQAIPKIWAKSVTGETFSEAIDKEIYEQVI